MQGNAGGEEAEVLIWYQRGRAGHPGLMVDYATFAAHLARTRRGTHPNESPAFIEDLYLAAGCVAHVEPAARIFRDRYGPIIRRALAGLAPTSTFLEDVEQQIYERILVGGPSSPPQLESYAGQAPLAAWLSIVAQRAGLMALRADGSQARARDAAAREKLVAGVYGAGIEADVVKQELRPLVKQALAQAWAELPARDRTVFHLHVVGGAGVERLGKMYGVNSSTISRWIGRARTVVLERTRQLLCAELRLTSAESDSLMSLVASQLDVTAGDLRLPDVAG